MFMSLNKTLILLTLIIVCLSVRAQQAPTDLADSVAVSFSGAIDTYYHKSFATVEHAPRTSFSNLPGFSLGMINLILEYKSKKSGITADLAFGPRGSDAVFNAPQYRNSAGAASSHIINQLYAFYNLSEHVRLNIGQFNTFFGYESISPTKNMQYSTSYLFSYGPFSHTGIWSDIQLGNHCGIKLAVMNPTDFTEFNPYDIYTAGAQLSYKGKHNVLNFNVSVGDPDGKLQASDSIGHNSAGTTLQTDLMGQFCTGCRVEFGLSASVRSIGPGQQKSATSDHVTLESRGYYGIAAYQTIRLNDNARIGLRTEYFYEYNNGVNAIAAYSDSNNASVKALTLNGNFRVSQLTVIPEIRFDQLSTKGFTLSANGNKTGSMTSATLAIVCAIPTVSHKFK
jgi:hypothetical protein